MSEMSEMSQTTKVPKYTTEGPGAIPGRLAVPWLTVVSLAVVMAYGYGFWLISLRGAVGAIERTEEPFVSWLRESTLVLPVFVLAVLGALTLAMRWFGPVLRRPRTVVATALMVVAAGTLAGIAGMVANSVYDYRLQSSQLQMMDSMRGVCLQGGCLASQQQASLELQARAVGYGSALLLATNLVLVGWVVAFRGGRLDVSTTRRRSARALPATPGADTAPRSRADDLRLLLAAGLFGSAAIHAAVVPAHLSEWAAAGAFFIVLTAVELAIGALLLAGLRPTVLLAAAVASIVPLAVWLYSRTLGIPFGPEAGIPEQVGLADSAACVLEVLTLLVAVVLLRHSGWLRRPRASAHVNALTVLAVIAVTAFGLAGSGLTWLDAFASSGDESVTSPTAPHAH
jgi:hypothetical protein